MIRTLFVWVLGFSIGFLGTVAYYRLREFLSRPSRFSRKLNKPVSTLDDIIHSDWFSPKRKKNKQEDFDE